MADNQLELRRIAEALERIAENLHPAQDPIDAALTSRPSKPPLPAGVAEAIRKIPFG